MDLESMLETKAVVHEAQYDVALASFFIRITGNVRRAKTEIERISYLTSD